MERVRRYSFGKGAERRNNRATIFEKTRYLHAWRVSRVDTPDTVLTTSHCYPEFRASHVAIARESVARWRNIFNGGCLGDWSTTRHCIVPRRDAFLSSFSPFPSLLAPLFHPPHLYLIFFFLLYFWHNLWKRSVEISRSWHFWIFHDCFKRISFQNCPIFDKLWMFGGNSGEELEFREHVIKILTIERLLENVSEIGGYFSAQFRR